MKEKLYLGVANEIITPAVGTALYGYRPDLFSNAINDDLTATAYYFRQADVKALMIGITVASIQTKLSAKLISEIEEEFHLPKGSCMLHCTHTHSAPNLQGEVGWGDIDWSYYHDIFLPALKKAVYTAMNHTIPVTMAVTQGESRVGINRRELNEENRILLGQNPWGPFDPRMTVITFRDEEEKIVANMIHYGCHGTASGINREVSRDWSGVMVDSVQELTGGVTAFFNGPEGDVGPRLNNGTTVGKHRVQDALELGGVASGDAMRIYRQPKIFFTPELKTSQKSIQIPLQPRIDRAFAEEQLAIYQNETINLSAAKRNYYQSVVDSYENGYVESNTRSFAQTVISIGEVAFVSFPYELFSEIGLRISQKSPFAYTLSLSNTNGASGYFATQDQICRGGYEIDMFLTSDVQPFVTDADYHMFKETTKHLLEMKEN